MLDQSFSAHNFEVIFDLENRKGNIDIKWMPVEYCEAVARMKELRHSISELRSKGRKKSEEDRVRIDELEKSYQKEKEKKENGKRDFLEECERKINSKEFVIRMNKYLDAENNKEVFTLNLEEPAVFFAIKQLQYNIHKTFKVKQSNRHQILCDIKTLLHTRMPLHIIRTDISSFYESIPQGKLLEAIDGNTLLNYKSKAFIHTILKLYDECKDTKLVAGGIGIPRGIGISPLLSEIYMRDIDAGIKTFSGTLFYARYVDDIFVVTTILPEGNKINDYFATLQKRFRDFGLTLKDETDSKGKCKLMDVVGSDIAYDPFDFLGYNITIERKNNQSRSTFGLSKNKIAHFKEKIDRIVSHFEKKSKSNIKEAYRDLFDSLNYVTGNTKLFKSKASVKVGLFYNNDLLDNMDDLSELQKYLRNIGIEPSHTANGWIECKSKIAKKVGQIDLQKRWRQKKMYHFSLSRIQEMEGWL